MNKRNLIIFDIDGTLTNSVLIHQTAFIKALGDLGVRSINSNFKEYKHHTDSYIAKVIYESDINEEFDASKIKEFEKHLLSRMTNLKIDEILGAKNLVAHIETQTDFGICYATGSLRKPAELKLKSIGIDYDKKQLVASNEILERENIVQKAIDNSLEFYNLKKFQRIISVGDGLWDLITANNLTIEFIGIGLANEKILKDNGAEFHYGDLTKFKIPNTTEK